MNATRLPPLAAAGLLAAAFWIGGAAADEPLPAGPAADRQAVLGPDELGLEPMDAAALGNFSGGFAVQTAIVDQTHTSVDNDVTILGSGQINTGTVDSSVTASGGISSTALISGINNNVQISTTLNLYFDQSVP